MTFQATTDAMTDGNPSMMKRRRHGAIGPNSANLTISQASVEANVVAKGAAARVVSFSPLPPQKGITYQI
jgi:hypothetical protein